MRKLVFTLILLLLLEVPKRLIFRNGDPSDYFYYNLLSCLQLFILLCIILIILTRPIFRRFKVRRILPWQILACLFLVAFLELGCRALLNNPKLIPTAVFPAFKFYYDHFECRILQYEPAATMFDSALYYKLRQNGSFVHSNREYSNHYRTNSKGFRDEDRSLEAADIICLGDSYTLGWGADKKQTYPALVEQQTGLDVLNAGMSSYGTARESMLLKELDTTQVKYIVWQYCSNDDEENNTYLANGHSLPVRRKEGFDSLMELHKWTRTYFPGRHFFTIAKLTVNEFRQSRRFDPPQKNDTTASGRASSFLEIVMQSPVDLSKTKIIVLDLSPYPLQNAFIQHLKKLVQNKGLDQNILLLDCTAILNKNDFYTLDVHLTPKGNEKVAYAISNLIRDSFTSSQLPKTASHTSQ